MILITTSHRPSRRIRSFVKDLVSILPYSIKVNRGHKGLVELAIETRYMGLRYIGIVTERHGNPGSIAIYEVADKPSPSLVKLATLIIHSVVLTRENPDTSKTYGVKAINIDASKCISDECFYLADLFIKIFSRALSDKPGVVIKLEEDKYITVRAVNIYEKPTGPIIRINRVIRGEI